MGGRGTEPREDYSTPSCCRFAGFKLLAKFTLVRGSGRETRLSALARVVACGWLGVARLRRGLARADSSPTDLRVPNYSFWYGGSAATVFINESIS